MATQIAFLRAVNLGNRTVKMARLVEVLESLGYDGVWTYINSGNAVFEASGRRGGPRAGDRSRARNATSASR